MLLKCLFYNLSLIYVVQQSKYKQKRKSYTDYEIPGESEIRGSLKLN